MKKTTEENYVLHACRCSTTDLTGIFQHFLATIQLIAHEKKVLGGHIASDNSTNSASVKVSLLSLCSLQEAA